MQANFKFNETLKGLPLLFQIFGLACILMFVIAAYSLFANLFREARIFFYIGLTGILVLSLVILGTSNRDLKETGVSQLFSLILCFFFLPMCYLLARKQPESPPRARPRNSLELPTASAPPESSDRPRLHS